MSGRVASGVPDRRFRLILPGACSVALLAALALAGVTRGSEKTDVHARAHVAKVARCGGLEACASYSIEHNYYLITITSLKGTNPPNPITTLLIGSGSPMRPAKPSVESCRSITMTVPKTYGHVYFERCTGLHIAPGQSESVCLTGLSHIVDRTGMVYPPFWVAYDPQRVGTGDTTGIDSGAPFGAGGAGPPCGVKP
jgi:hypothetical protein